MNKSPFVVETRLYKIEFIFKHLFYWVDTKGNIFYDWNDCPKHDFYEIKRRH